eukprot:TRINITY_DN11553_c0_g1_i1.p1 TRINITY_DN11553_c0_g1~~TRINITY_DN11553_c0_g1_i1.p1  ORF type:complete len:258 (+),score=43.75 TRINITY_DN11553_c0_g1_i1:64-837(+)
MYEGFATLPTVMAASVVFWTLLYFAAPLLFRVFPCTNSVYAKLDHDKQIDMCLRIVSTAHAVVVVQGAVYALSIDKEMWDDYVWAHSPTAELYMAIAAGYFLWDTIMCLIHFKSHGVGFLLHGIGCFLAYTLAFIPEKPFLRFYGCYFLLWEISTPLLNMRFFLETFGNRHSTMYLINGFLFAGSFFFVRILAGIYTSVEVWQLLPNDLTVPRGLVYYYLTANAILNTLNVLWFFKIVKGVAKTLATHNKSANQKAE